MKPMSDFLENGVVEEEVHDTLSERVVHRFKRLYQQLNAGNAHGSLIDQVYSPEMVFEDSFHRIEGVPDFKAYCASVYENLSYCHFEFHQSWINQEDAMLIWTMRYAHPRLNKGNEITLEGASHIRFDNIRYEGKVYYHRDYFDGGRLLYEHVPLLGSVIKQLKKRMV